MCSLKNRITELNIPQFVQQIVSKFKEKSKLEGSLEYFCDLIVNGDRWFLEFSFAIRIDLLLPVILKYVM
nr:unnamed protein product [Callosobruchus chinensis]